MGALFDEFKEKFAKSLVNQSALKIDDVFVLAKSLATEQVKDPDMWNTFARIAVEKEHEVAGNRYFRNYSDLAWSLSKANYDGLTFWNFIQEVMTTELTRF